MFAYYWLIGVRTLLVTRNLGLAYRLTDRWHRLTGADRDEIQSAALLGLCRASLVLSPGRYDPSRGVRFATFAWYGIEFAIRTYLNKAKRCRSWAHLRAVKFPDGNEAEWIPHRLVDHGESCEDVDLRDECEQLLSVLDARSRDMLERHTCGDETYESIGASHGVTRERVRQIIERAKVRVYLR